MSAPEYEFTSIEAPYDEYEHQILRQITLLQQRYQAELEPWIKRLSASRATKETKYIAQLKPTTREGD